METMINRLRRDCSPPSRNLFGECAKDGDSTSVRSTIAAPYKGRVFDVLPFEDIQMLAIVFQFSVDHGLRAVEASVFGIGGRDANVDSRQAIAESLRQDIRWTQICS